MYLGDLVKASVTGNKLCGLGFSELDGCKMIVRCSMCPVELMAVVYALVRKDIVFRSFPNNLK